MIRPRSDSLAIVLEKLAIAALKLKLCRAKTKPGQESPTMGWSGGSSHGITEPDIPDGATHADLPYYDRHGERMVDCDGSPLESD